MSEHDLRRLTDLERQVEHLTASQRTVALPIFDWKTYGAIGDGASHPLSERFATLAEAQAVYPHATGLPNEIDWAAIQKAINVANAAGGGRAVGPPGTYVLNIGLSLKDRVTLEGAGIGATTLDFSSMTAPVDGGAITAAGSLTSLGGLSANVAKGANTLAFSVAPPVAVGDVLLIYDATDFSWSGARATYRKGEYLRVVAVSGSTVTTATRTFDSYTAGTNLTVYRLTPVRTGVRGLSARFTAGYGGIRIVHGVGVTLADLDLTGSDTNQISLDRCYECAVRGVRAVDYSAAGGTNYGVIVGNSQRIAVTDCFLETTRHGYATGGANVVGSVPNRELTIRGGTISSSGGSLGLDVHGNAEHVLIDGVHLPQGTDVGGDAITIQNCDIRSSDVGGYAINALSEMLGANYTIRNNRITANQAFTYLIAFEARTGRLTRSGGHLRVEDNVIDLGGYATANWPTTPTGVIHVYNASSGASNDVTVRGNLIRNAPTTPGALSGVWVRAESGFGWRDVDVRDNTMRGARVEVTASAAMIDILRNRVDDALDIGILVIPVTTPAPAPERVRVNDNYVRKAWRGGIQIQNYNTTHVEVRRNTAINNLQGGNTGTSSTNGSCYVTTARRADVTDNIFGDDQSPATQLTAYSFNLVTDVYEHNNILIGGPVTQVLASLTNRYKDDVLATKTAAYTATEFDSVLACNAASAAFTLMLPTAINRAGKRLTVKKIDSSANAVTIDAAGSETIDGALTHVLTAQWQVARLVSNGANWLLV